ncbi:cytosolic endo-beta-N-acetylglucosaminidase-like isoform X1 [Dermacentor variabilis]|uniref:cytosolic endo-beta-N-acetylglucosaminidase-like isoform X1 n=1 Tax=Dermacentor variabilis TaxID=34621 RepID=UPI003F5B6417
MGITLSRTLRGRPKTRVVEWPVQDREVAPLETLNELLEYKEQPLLCAVEPLSDAVKRGRPGEPRTIFCHDMGGGYCEDRFIYGCNQANGYRFHHWQIIDTFIYYSHHMVTIPPPGWISAAHKHGVKVLGTFILGEEDIKTLNRVRGSGLVPQVAAQLARVASMGWFDGWLISIGCKVDASCVPFLKDLLRTTTTETHKAVPGSLVIWYDAVDIDGKSEPQNELNRKNSCFLDLCDGIFLNFHWTEVMLRKSAQIAGDRKVDVYAGVDVYARGTSYPGGYDMYKAVQLVRRCGLSAAVFAAAWVYETQEKKKFEKNQYRLWNFPDDCCSEFRLTKLPLSTCFCQGFGKHTFADGQRESSRAWFNLHKQQLQPRDQGNALCDTCCSVKLHTDDAYNGGGCLRVLFKRNRRFPDAKPYIRLFGCEFPLGSLAVSYTFKNISSCIKVGQDIALVLKAKNVAGETEEIFLGLTVGLPDGDNYTVTQEIIKLPDASQAVPGTYWLTRKYLLEDLRGAGGAILEEIGLHFFCIGTEANVCLLGQLDVKRPAVAKAASSDDSSSGDDEPEKKRQREERYGLDTMEAE